MRRKMRVCKICAILRFSELWTFWSFCALLKSLKCCMNDRICKFNLLSSLYNKNLHHNFEKQAVNAYQSRVLKMVFFQKCIDIKNIYPPELQLNLESSGDTVNFLDLSLTNNNGHVDVKLYDKRDDFPFSIVRLLFTSSNIPSRTIVSVQKSFA